MRREGWRLRRARNARRRRAELLEAQRYERKPILLLPVHVLFPLVAVELGTSSRDVEYADRRWSLRSTG
jgi:hypothetical protein